MNKRINNRQSVNSKVGGMRAGAPPMTDAILDLAGRPH